MAYSRFEDLNPDALGLAPEEVESYKNHVGMFFDRQLFLNILDLPENRKEKAWQMFHDYSDILSMIIRGTYGIVDYIALNNPYYPDQQDPLINAYDAWRARNNIDNFNELYPEANAKLNPPQEPQPPTV